MNRDSRMDPTNSVGVPTNEFAKLGLAFETTTMASLMDLSGTTGHAGPTMFHNRSRSRWLTHEIHSTLSVVVHKSGVWFEIVREALSGSNSENVDFFFCSYLRFCILIHLKCLTALAIEPLCHNSSEFLIFTPLVDEL